MNLAKTLFWIVRFVPPVALIGCIVYIIILIKNKSNWKTSGDDKIKREQNIFCYKKKKPIKKTILVKKTFFY